MYSILEELNDLYSKDTLGSANTKLTEMYAHYAILPHKFSEQGILDPQLVLQFLSKNASVGDVIEIGLYSDITAQFALDCEDAPEPKIDPYVPPFNYTTSAYKATQYVTSLTSTSPTIVLTTEPGTPELTNYYFEFEADRKVHNLDILSKTAIYYPHEFKQMLNSGSVLTPNYVCQTRQQIDPLQNRIFYVGIEGKGAIGHPTATPTLNTSKSAAKKRAKFVTDLELVGISREVFPDVLEETLTNMELDTGIELKDPFTFTCKLDGQDTTIEVISLLVGKCDFDEARITLVLDKNIIDYADLIQVIHAIRLALIDEGYDITAFLNTLKYRHNGNPVDSFTFKYSF